MNKILRELKKLSTKAFDLGEIPVGAVVVKDGIIVGRGYNNRQSERIVTGHAEIMAINKAAKKLGDWRLDGCELYVSLKPCSMCTEVIKNSRIKKIYYFLDNTTNNYQHVDLIYEKLEDQLLENTLKEKMDEFFKSLR